MSDEQALTSRASEKLDEHMNALRLTMSRVFIALMVLQWAACIIIAVAISPKSWDGAMSSIHPHLWAALGIGTAIALPCTVMLVRQPTAPLTRHASCIGQVLFSSLLIHLMGGRIETHFHVFGSLAFISMYLDWRLLVAPTLLIAADHMARGLAWPQSVYGVSYAPLWRTLEHAGWVLFEDTVLVYACVYSTRNARKMAMAMAEVEHAKACVEDIVSTRTRELVDAQTMMRSERNLFESIVQNIPIGVYWKGTDLEYQGCNHCFATQNGFTHVSDLVGKTDRDTQSGPAAAETEGASEQQILDTGEAVVNREVVRIVGGEQRKFMTSKVPLRNEHQEVVGIVGLTLDITEQRNLEEHLAQSQKLESIGQLAAGISHEINTPVQYVSDNIRFLKDQFAAITSVIHEYASQLEPNTPQIPWVERRAIIQKKIDELDFPFVLKEVPLALDQSLDGLKRVATIVLAMKEFSHPGGAGKEPADVNKAIQSTATVCTNRWKYHADLKFDLAPQLPLVPCIVAEFNQVILNLIVNAADAIADKRGSSGEKGQIVVSTRVDRDCVEVRVADDGSGIPDSVRHKIFSPFFTTKGVGKGTGQGLALSQNIVVKKLGGQITFETTPGKGTTFIIRLPMLDTSKVAALKEAA